MNTVLAIAIIVLTIGGVIRMQHSYRLQRRIEELELLVGAMMPKDKREVFQRALPGEHECRHVGGVHYCKCSVGHDHQAHEGHRG